MHLAIALFIYEYFIKFLKHDLAIRLLSLGAMFIILTSSIFYRVAQMSEHVKKMFDEENKLIGYRSPVKPYLFLADYVSDGDVILGSTRESWVIPAITGAKIVSPQKINPLIFHEAKKRRQDVKMFLESDLTLDDRAKLLAKYHVTHIIIEQGTSAELHASLINDTGMLAEEIIRKNDITLYKMKE